MVVQGEHTLYTIVESRDASRGRRLSDRSGEACQRAIDAGLVVHRAHPLNCETSIPALIGGIVMPNAHVYVRDHVQIPLLDASPWRLGVGGLVERSLRVSLRDLTRMRSSMGIRCASSSPAGTP